MPISGKLIKILFIFSLFAYILPMLKTQTFAEDFGNVPVKIQAALFMKLLVFNKGISENNTISLYVAGNPDFAAEMRKAIGKKIGNATLSDVKEGEGLPTRKYSVIYVGDASKLDTFIRYTRENQLLSITGVPWTVSKGVSLGVGVADGKPKVLLNISASKAEGILWNPAIFKISTIFK